MKILYDNTLSTKQLPKNHTLIFNSHVTPLKLNIKLKTHSLTCLDIPLETFINYKDISSSYHNIHQKTIAGSVDLISEIQQQINEENLPNKSLINILSPNKQQTVKQDLKHRFQLSNLSILSKSINDSVVRLRRSGHIQNIHQSSLQTLNNINKQKKFRHSFIHNRYIPKFTFRNLPLSSINQTKKSSKNPISSFTSLPEIRSFIEENSLNSSKNLNKKFQLTSSWKKSSSWSWKSNNTLEKFQLNHHQSTIINKDIQYQINDNLHSNLPVIIESPIQKRSFIKISSKNFQDLNSNNKNDENSRRLYKKKNSFPHSISNYEISQNRFIPQTKIRYPSTPLLADSRHKPIDISSITNFIDDDDDDDTDSISSTSSFRSCLNSIHEYLEDNITEFSSSLSENCFPDISLNTDINNQIIKHNRLSIRHFCILQ